MVFCDFLRISFQNHLETNGNHGNSLEIIENHGKSMGFP